MLQRLEAALPMVHYRFHLYAASARAGDLLGMGKDGVLTYENPEFTKKKWWFIMVYLDLPANK